MHWLCCSYSISTSYLSSQQSQSMRSRTEALCEESRSRHAGHLVQSDVDLHAWLASPNLLRIVIYGDDVAPHHQLLIWRRGFPVSHLHAAKTVLTGSALLTTLQLLLCGRYLGNPLITPHVKERGRANLYIVQRSKKERASALVRHCSPAALRLV